MAGPTIRAVDALVERNIISQHSVVEYNRVLEDISAQIDDLNSKIGDNSAL